MDGRRPSGVFWGLSWKAYKNLGRLQFDDCKEDESKLSSFFSKKAILERWNHRRLRIANDLGDYSKWQGPLLRTGQAVLPVILIFGSALALFLLIQHLHTGLGAGQILKNSWNWTIHTGTNLSRLVEIGLPVLVGTTLIGFGIIAHARHKNYLEYSQSPN